MQRLIFSFLLFSSMLTVKAQDTLWFSTEGFPVFTWLDSEIYAFYTRPDTADITLETAYYLDGSLKRQCAYANWDKDIKHGKCTEYYEGGKPRYQLEYKEGLKHGNFITFHPNGQMKRQDFYQNDTLVSGWNYNESGKRVESYPFEERPAPRKGMEAFLKEIEKQVELSDEEKGVKVEVSFWITRDGSVMVPMTFSENEEAAEAIKNAFQYLRSWRPGFRDGELDVFREYMTFYLDPKKYPADK